MLRISVVFSWYSADICGKLSNKYCSFDPYSKKITFDAIRIFTIYSRTAIMPLLFVAEVLIFGLLFSKGYSERK